MSKGAIRVEAYGTVDELNAALAFARSICDEPVIASLARSIQQDLFKLASALATPPDSPKPAVRIDAAMVDRLTAEVHRIEGIDGMLSDWSLSGDLTVAAAFNLARTVCRRAERCVVRLVESPDPVQPAILAYLNR
ncbi:MAG TPA: ATP:cob(I)alamin adenosyltransferase, partial [Vicinamibacterales bacterium]|nr:ATP:cob(I)alamin adenosyltransferase [Vicinamibacterales bacterium]